MSRSTYRSLLHQFHSNTILYPSKCRNHLSSSHFTKNSETLYRFIFAANGHFRPYTTQPHIQLKNHFRATSELDKLFKKKEYQQIIHLYRKKNLVRYDADEPLRPNGKPKPVDTAVYLKALTKEGLEKDLYEAFRYLMDPKHPSSIVFNTMVECLLDLGKYEDAVKVYKHGLETRRHGSLVTPKTIGIFMRYLVQQKRFDDAILFYQKHCHAKVFTNFRVDPDIGLVHMLVRAFIQNRDLLGARRALEFECLEHKLTPTVEMVEELIKAHLNKGNVKGAYWVFMDLFTRDEESQVSNPMIRLLGTAAPSPRVLNMILLACMRKRKVEMALELFDRYCVPSYVQQANQITGVEETVLRAPQFTPTPAILETILTGLNNHGHSEAALQVYQALFRGSNAVIHIRSANPKLARAVLIAHATTRSPATQQFFTTFFGSKDVSKKGEQKSRPPTFPLDHVIVRTMMEYYIATQQSVLAARLFLKWSKSPKFILKHKDRRVQAVLQQTIEALGENGLVEQLLPFVVLQADQTEDDVAEEGTFGLESEDGEFVSEDGLTEEDVGELAEETAVEQSGEELAESDESSQQTLNTEVLTTQVEMEEGSSSDSDSSSSSESSSDSSDDE